MKRLALLSLLVLAAACSPRIVQPVAVKDSVRVEIRERLVHDTVTFEVPKIVEKNVTLDTCSHIENEYAESEAWVSSGRLNHILMTRPHIVKVPVVQTVTDTVIVEKQAETIIKEVNVLTGWQKLWISLGKVLAAAFCLVTGLFIARIIINGKI